MRRGKVFDLSDPELRRTLPQHDFNIPEVNVTPSSFRFLRMKVEDIEGDYNFLYRFLTFLIH